MLIADLNFFFLDALSLTLWCNLYLEINTAISISKLYLIYYCLHYFDYSFHYYNSYIYIHKYFSYIYKCF